MARTKLRKLTDPVWIRFPEGVAEALDAVAEAEGSTKSAVARRFVIEGLRRHPVSASLSFPRKATP